MLFGDLLDRALAEGAGPRTALIDGTGAFSYDELDAAADRFAGQLVRRGYRPGARAALCARNGLAYGIIVLGAARAGVVLIHLSTRATAGEIEAALTETGAEVLFAGEDMQSDRVPVVHLTRDGDAWFGTGPAERPVLDLADDAPLALLYSGGTTGAAKGVLVSHRARLVTAEIAAGGLGLEATDRVLVSTPLFHTAALFCWLAPAWLQGATVVVGDKWSAAGFIDLVERERVTAAFLVPTQIGDLLAAPELDAGRLASLRLVCHAGAPMPPDRADRLARLLPEADIAEHYGLSETGLLTVRRRSDPADRPGSVGHPPPPVELAVRGPDGAFLPPGTVGEIATRGPHLLSGLIGGTSMATLFPWHDGWLATGDRGRLDTDGSLTLLARSRDVIVSGAENLYPGEIEAVLLSHPALAECAVFGVPDERLGEVPVAQVVLRPGMAATETELIDHVLSLLPRHKRPRRIIFAPALPRSAVGKVLKAQLAAAFSAARSHA
ncbi:fatty-acid--CoA ligase [Aliidongia dinghuensis]|uniref:Fatty-acid--CoA ligase n=1 Tax=Aliidongia dinghuensis TaxID=1867774 RepID=A0A8J2Z0E4_9PROT|nr:AMP-binding protein [Aliidongia dinghuensis]GGF39306.1 fatty-acid--CoA ligase [Aliidongia dinghuensis]